MKENRWFQMRANNDASVDIDIFDEIGLWGITAKDFKEELQEKDTGGHIRVSINSPGGDVFDGLAIYSLLAERRDRVSVEVYGLAASIASIIALAGKELIMRAGTFFMIHDPWSLVIGNSDEMRKTADILDKIAAQIFGIYSERTALTDDELKAAMKSETWYTPQEAVDAGFASVVQGEKVAASVNFDFLNKFSNRPASLETVQALSQPNQKEDAMENVATENVQAKVEPVQDKTDERFAALESKIEEVHKNVDEKLASISVRPQVKPDLKDEGAQWFYDSLREASNNHGAGFKATARELDTADGVGIPVAASSEILMNVNQMSIMRKYGAEVRPAGAQSTRFTTVVDSGSAAILEEGGSYSDAADPTLITMALYKLAGRFSLTEEVDEDTIMDMYSAFQRYAARLIARGENAYFISGSGSDQPKGVDEETASVTAAAHDAVTFAELLELDESLDPEWDYFLGDPDGGNYMGPIYLMSASTAEAIRALTDTNSNYYFRQHEDGRLKTMFGRPVIRNSNVANMGTVDNPAIILVNPMAYLIAERRPNIAIKVGYDNDTHSITWDFNERVGGQVWDSNGVAVLQMAATT